MKKIISILATIGILSYAFYPFFPISASPDFDPNYIISDNDLTDYTSMDLNEIQNFLENKKSSLASYKTKDANGSIKMAAEIIYEAAQEYKISPKYILVTLQKEQSLIENNDPSQYNYDWAMGYARCDDCDPTDPRIVIFKGFGNQVDRGTWRQRYYLDNKDEKTWIKHPGETYKIDGYLIVPKNQATANLYTYTPHYNGNYNFFKIWKRWFIRLYPDGSLLQVKGEPGVWYIQNGYKRPITSKSALISRFDESKILTVSKNELDIYPIGKEIKFPNYSLLKSPDGAIYLLVDDKLRHIDSMDIFRTIGFNIEEVEKITKKEVDAYAKGKPITIKSVYPLGALLQDKTTGGVYFVKDGIKKPIWSKEIMENRFPGRKLTPVSPEELAKYPTGDPVKFKDGELVVSASSPAVYIISNGFKRPIVSGEVFEKLGYKWKNIIRTTDRSLEIHPTGEMITGNFINKK